MGIIIDRTLELLPMMKVIEDMNKFINKYYRENIIRKKADTKIIIKFIVYLLLV
jgi:hypothetical protein